MYSLCEFLDLIAAKEKLEIVIGAAEPRFEGHFLAAAGGENGSDYFKNTAQKAHCTGRSLYQKGNNLLTLASMKDNIKYMIQQFTAIYKKRGKWFLGWIEEIPGANTQGRTLKEAKENLKEALSLIIEENRTMSRKEITGKVIREPVTLALR